MAQSKRANPLALRPSDKARELLAAIAESLGLSLTATLEVIIREAAATRGISQLTTGATQ